MRRGSANRSSTSGGCLVGLKRGDWREGGETGGARVRPWTMDRYYACPLVSSAGRCWLQSMNRSLHPPLLQNPACDFHRTRLLSEAPLSWVSNGRNAVRQTCDLRFGAFP